MSSIKLNTSALSIAAFLLYVAPSLAGVSGETIRQIGFLPNGKEIVSLSPDGAVRVWDAATGKELRTLVKPAPSDGSLTFMRTAPDGTVVTARGDRLSFFKGGHKPEEIRLTGLSTGLRSMKISPDGKTLLLVSFSLLVSDDKMKALPIVEIWDVPRRRMISHLTLNEGPDRDSLGISSDRRIAGLTSGVPCLLDASGAVSRSFDSSSDSPRNTAYYWDGEQPIVFSPEGGLLAFYTPEDGLRLMDLATGNRRRLITDGDKKGRFNAVFSPNGRMIAAETADGKIDVWEISSGRRRRRFVGHGSDETTLAFSLDGRRLATGNADGTIHVWDVFGKVAEDAPKADPLADAELDALWTGLGEEDAERACLAMGRLMRRPTEAGPYLKRRLLSRKTAEMSRLKQWIADLDDDAFAVRETASTELAEHLPTAAPLLRSSLATNLSAEARHRTNTLLEGLEFQRLPRETLQDLRSLEIVESYGAAAAKDVIRELSEGNFDPSVVAAAKAAHKRLTGKTSNP